MSIHSCRLGTREDTGFYSPSSGSSSFTVSSSPVSSSSSSAISMSIETSYDKTADIKLNNSRSPETVKAILNALPLQLKINRWGDEFYTDKTPIVAEEENARSVVDLLDVASLYILMDFNSAEVYSADLCIKCIRIEAAKAIDDFPATKSLKIEPLLSILTTSTPVA